LNRSKGVPYENERSVETIEMVAGKGVEAPPSRRSLDRSGTIGCCGIPKNLRPTATSYSRPPLRHPVVALHTLYKPHPFTMTVDLGTPSQNAVGSATKAWLYPSARNEDVQRLIGSVDAYNPSNLQILEGYLEDQIQGEGYDCLANLAVLKL
jgi:hypothetical protein